MEQDLVNALGTKRMQLVFDGSVDSNVLGGPDRAMDLILGDSDRGWTPKMAEEDDGDGGSGSSTGIITKTKPKTKKPSLYKVLLLNDDYTPMDFVIQVLEQIFSKGREDATRIMLHVHQHGVGICGVYTYEVAETKVANVIEFARRHQHPLQCTMEKD